MMGAIFIKFGLAPAIMSIRGDAFFINIFFTRFQRNLMPTRYWQSSSKELNKVQAIFTEKAGYKSFKKVAELNTVTIEDY